MSREKQAFIILFDNSYTTLDGDYFPNRLVAQEDAVEDIGRKIISENQESLFGFGTLALPNYGIVTALTRDTHKIRAGLDSVQRGNIITIDRSIRCALCALRHKPVTVTKKKILVILGSIHDLIESAAKNLANAVNKEGVGVDFVIYGNDVSQTNIIDDFVKMLVIPSEVRYIKQQCNLSTAIFNFINAFDINNDGTGNAGGIDADIEEAIRQSREEAGNINTEEDDQMQIAIQNSLMEQFGMGGINKDEPPPKSEEEELSPELLEAIEFSKTEEKNTKKDEQNDDK